MDNEQKKPADVGKGDSFTTRTKDNPIGVDDIGLPADMQKDELSRLQDIRPDPDKAKDKQ